MQTSPELVLQPLLANGERLLWSGRPRAGIVLQMTDFVGFGMALFGLVVVGVVYAQTMGGADSAQLVFLVPFALVWFSIAAGQPIWRARRLRNVAYGLTDQRALILPGKSTDLQSISFAKEGNVTLQTRADGTGTILFGNYSAAAVQTLTGPAFRNIDNVNAVYQIIQGIQTESPSDNWQSA